MLKNNKNREGFTIIVAILMIGFLLVLTTGVLNLVLRERKDNKGQEKYLQSYSAAEGALELGLLGIKENGYPFDKDLSVGDTGSEVLSFETAFDVKSDPKIVYSSDIKASKFEGEIGIGKTEIIPLFWKEEHTAGISAGTAKELFLKVLEGNQTSLIWNIIGEDFGFSGKGLDSFNIDGHSYRKPGVGGGFSTIDITVNQFLQQLSGAQSYLVIFNSSVTQKLKYQLEDTDGGSFSRPIGTLTSSALVGKYKQNIVTNIDNTEFLNMLQYSIYDN